MVFNNNWGRYVTLTKRRIYGLPSRLLIAFRILTLSNFVVVLSGKKGTKTRVQLGGIYILEPMLVLKALRSTTDNIARFYRAEVPKSLIIDEAKEAEEDELLRLIEEVYEGRI